MAKQETLLHGESRDNERDRARLGCGAGTPRALIRTMISGVLNCLVQIENGNWPDPPPNPCNKEFIDMVVHDKQDKPLL